ncbi:hypothetical protein ACFOPN_04175 [Xanthomonas hyacinthi]|uniref:hypothetical protein n=1 Tax=Xanthomonas hyacinthi TaxID=56455 RepID=UPI000AE625AB
MFAMRPVSNALQQTCKPSTGPHCVNKMGDVVGLYLATLDRALVLCVDETGQIHSPNRSRPGLSLTVGEPATRIDAGQRHGRASPSQVLRLAQERRFHLRFGGPRPPKLPDFGFEF